MLLPTLVIDLLGSRHKVAFFEKTDKEIQSFEFKLPYTTRGKRSQLFLIVFRYGWVHNLSMLLVWKRSETSHHLGDERQIFLQHQRIVSRFLAISSVSAATTIINY